jgi:predicted lipid-binding transport protein (Tim44 family)
LLTSLIDSRGTLVGAVLVGMTVSALGQAMRGPLDRLERRIEALGVARGILIVGLVGFLLGAGAAGARDILQGGRWTSAITRKLQSASTDHPSRSAPTTSVSDDDEAKTTQDKPPSRSGADTDKEPKAQPAPTPNSAASPVPSGPDRP